MFPSKEQKVIDSLKRYLNFKPGKKFPLDIGDDAALRNTKKGEKLIFTADSSVEGVHFSFDWMSPEELGYRAMVRNISDCAAMGAEPDFAIIQMLIPGRGESTEKTLKQIYRGIKRACGKWRFPVTGGDISRGPCWAVCVTMAGKVEKRVMKRGSARSGDLVWVTGNPGASAAGLAAIRKWGRDYAHVNYPFFERAHIKPAARTGYAAELACNPEVHSLIDISDGVAKESLSVSKESNVEIEIDMSKTGIKSEMKNLAKRLNRNVFEWYLTGGEDYELLFTTSSYFSPDSLKGKLKLRCIGKCIRKGSDLSVINTGTDNFNLKSAGWDHLVS